VTPPERKADHAAEIFHHPLLARANDVAARILAPRANATDLAEEPPADNLRHLADAGLLGLTTPVPYGGQGAARPIVRACLETLAAACGVTTFLASRHLLACRQIGSSPNAALKRTLLPQLASGALLCARGTTHLRRDGPPVLRAAIDGKTVVLNGTAPWVSGWGLMDYLLLGGTLPDGQLVYVVVPLCPGEGLHASPPMRLCAMNASATVSLTCDDLRVGPDGWVGMGSREAIDWADALGVLGRTTGPFAVARASLALLNTLAEEQKSAVLVTLSAALARELAAARQETRHWMGRVGTAGYWASALRTAAWAHELSVRAAHAAVTAAGGKANDCDHVAQRLFREAMFYTLYLQTRGVQAATLERLAASADWAVGQSGAAPG
jgi:alkylation response protein AidB-like acyl-CoA dehydrogenase